jgi:RNA ligase
MTHITDVIGGRALLLDMMDQGYVSRRFHPEFPELAILNYTEKAAFEGVWNRVTLNTRGLIYDTISDEVLARPFKKFFNYGQTGAPDIDLDARPYFVSDKFDGSLGIAYRQPDGLWAIATRGSFESEQAKHATAIVRELGEDKFLIEHLSNGGKATPLFEIIYPENRIVVDYGDTDTLQSLGAVWIESGDYIAWGGQGTFDYRTFREVIEAKPRPNAEGFVVWLDRKTAVKIKQDDYVELHRIVTGLNRKSVWRALKDGEPTFKALQEQLPDELYNWSSDVAKELREEYANHIREIDGWYISTLDQDIWIDEFSPDEKIDRKKFALTVQKGVNGVRPPDEYRGFMFSLLDGKPIEDKIWAMIEPTGGDR